MGKTPNINYEHNFILNRQAATKKMIRDKVTVNVLLFICIGLITVIMANSGFYIDFWRVVYIGVTMETLYLIFVAAYVVVILRKTPKEIHIDLARMVVGHDVFEFSDIKSVTLTPWDYYTGSQKRILNITTNKKNEKYYLGFKNPLVDEAFPEYQKFTAVMASKLKGDEDKFRFLF